MANEAIRKILDNRRIRHWEVAIEVGISEQTLSRWLRRELTGDRRERVMAAINKLCN